jgi:hypothetical protein
VLGSPETSDGSRGATEVLAAAAEEEVDVLRRARAPVKRHGVAAHHEELNRVAGEFLQQLFEVGGKVHWLLPS